MKKFTKHTIELPGPLSIVKLTTGLSIVGLCFSMLLEYRYGTDVSLTKVRLQGAYKDKIFVRNIYTCSGNAVSMYYPGEEEVTGDFIKADRLEYSPL